MGLKQTENEVNEKILEILDYLHIMGGSEGAEHKDDRVVYALDEILKAVSSRPIEEQAADLIRNAEAQRKVVTIQTQPLLPLAMGNYKMVYDVRDARVRS